MDISNTPHNQGGDWVMPLLMLCMPARKDLSTPGNRGKHVCVCVRGGGSYDGRASWQGTHQQVYRSCLSTAWREGLPIAENVRVGLGRRAWHSQSFKRLSAKGSAEEVSPAQDPADPPVQGDECSQLPVRQQCWAGACGTTHQRPAIWQHKI